MNLQSAHAVVMMPRRIDRHAPARTSWFIWSVSAPSRALDWMLATLAR